MHVFEIEETPGFSQWRTLAREALLSGLSPETVMFKTPHSSQTASLFDALKESASEKFKDAKQVDQMIKISQKALSLMESAACHSDPERYNLLYRVLFRLNQNKRLLSFYTDPDVNALRALVKAVRRDAYKIKAFLRFREVTIESSSHFIAWYEPEHYTLELVLDFFCTRFKNMNWSILTPYKAAHWNQQTLSLDEHPDPALYPKDDNLESYWLTYYASTFNPNRVKVQAMLNQMPKKYWKNMPETTLIVDLLKGKV